MPGDVPHNQTAVVKTHMQLTPKEQALHLLRRGWKPRAVANYLELNHNTVRGWASKSGLTKQGNSEVAPLPKGRERNLASNRASGVTQHNSTAATSPRGATLAADDRTGGGSNPSSRSKSLGGVVEAPRADTPEAPCSIPAPCSKLPTHIVIPDTQCKPGVPLEHLYWAGKYIAERKPDVVVHLGDHWDMASLSSYEKRGSKYFEGKRIMQDIEAGNWGMEMLMTGMGDFRPARLILLRGNHEDRITRFLNEEPGMEGLVSLGDLLDTELGWEVVPYLEPITVDGVTYSHYFYNPNTGRSYSGAVETMLRNIGFTFTMGHQQGLRWGRRELPNGQTQIGCVAGCLTPDHRVLTADLRYVPIGELKVGDQLVSFDENCGDSGGRGRRFRTGTLLKTARDTAPVFAVRLSSGKTFKVTADHGWLVRRRGATDYQWRLTSDLQVGDKLPRVLAEWESAASYEAGWLAGMYDGEGCLYARETTGGYVCQLGISQKEGPLLARIQKGLQELLGDAPVTEHVHDGVMSVRLQGGAPAIARALGTLRPTRLLAKFKPELLGGLTVRQSKAGRGLDEIVSIEPLGEAEIVRTLVDCGTLIVEGYPHHNSFYQHNEDYRGPQAASEWRGLVVKHEVANGDYDPMFVSLDFLRKRYG